MTNTCARCCKNPCCCLRPTRRCHCCGHPFTRATRLAEFIDPMRVDEWWMRTRNFWKFHAADPLDRCLCDRCCKRACGIRPMRRPREISRKQPKPYLFVCPNHKCRTNEFIATENILTLVKEEMFCHPPEGRESQVLERMYETNCPTCGIIVASSRIWECKCGCCKHCCEQRCTPPRYIEIIMMALIDSYARWTLGTRRRKSFNIDDFSVTNHQVNNLTLTTLTGVGIVTRTEWRRMLVQELNQIASSRPRLLQLGTEVNAAIKTILKLEDTANGFEQFDC